jgi:dTDP-glucose pyrophosphorylase
MKSSVISHERKVRDLATLLEDHSVLFVERDRVLVGSITNGDFRRGIAAGASLDEGVTRIMNTSPVAVRETDDYSTRLERVRGLPQGLRYLPVLNERDQIVEIVSDKALMTLPNIAVIMAGGLGSRLKTLTESLPKPMLKVGEKPLLQLIIENLRRAGVSRFLLSVNYKGEIIREYFRDGADLEVQIGYLQEKDRLGTAGCLSLLDNPPSAPFLVMNGDILADVDFQALLGAHQHSGAMATVCLAEHRLSIPYGVVHTEGERIKQIEEKPSPSYYVNAGVYVLTPACLSLIPFRQYFDMTALLERILESGQPLNSFKLKGLWIDIGDLEDFRRANLEYRELT